LSLGAAKDRKTATFAVRFIHPGASDRATSRAQQNAAPAQQAQAQARQGWLVDPAKQNTDYAWSGDRKSVRLKRAFDDGQFTWFQFEENAEIPAIYVVGPDGTEATVNARRQGNFMVVERTAALFTLRTGPDGKTTLCVKNNAKT
jgi:type IV secretion system protein VirB9